MDRIYAPWRKEFIERDDRQGECIFCSRVGLDPAETNLILRKGRTAMILLNKFPYNNGHIMVAPFRHTADFPGLAPEESAECMTLMAASIEALRKAYSPDGFNIGMNLGSAAGAGVADHLHWHIVPRWTGDANFMPLIGKTRVLHEILYDSYSRLAPHLGGV